MRRKGRALVEYERAEIGSCDAEWGWIAELADIVGLTVFDRVKIPDIFGGERGVKDSVPGVNEIAGSEVIVIGPFQVSVKVRLC